MYDENFELNYFIKLKILQLLNEIKNGINYKNKKQKQQTIKIIIFKLILTESEYGNKDWMSAIKNRN